MMDALHKILELQELDMNMIRLMDLKRKRQRELDEIHSTRRDLEGQVMRKNDRVLELKKNIKLAEVRLREMDERIEELEKKQAAVKKVDEFNALSREITNAGRQKAGIQKESDELEEKLVVEEEGLTILKADLQTTVESSEAQEKEIREGVVLINNEGAVIKLERDKQAEAADSEIFGIYERLLRNKKDRVLVPIENRACTGCHIVITAQHENLVRKGERLVFCEHCSRIHYWPQEGGAPTEETEAAPKRRRRRTPAAT
jgi:uncharacterized protein